MPAAHWRLPSRCKTSRMARALPISAQPLLCACGPAFDSRRNDSHRRPPIERPRGTEARETGK